MGLGSKETIQESSYSVFSFFFFHQRAFGNFRFRHRDRFVHKCWLEVPICRHRLICRLLIWKKIIKFIQSCPNVCILDQLNPCSYRRQNTQTQLSQEQTRACKVYCLLEFFSFWVCITPAINTKKTLPSRPFVAFTRRLWKWPFAHSLYSSNERQEDNMLLS